VHSNQKNQTYSIVPSYQNNKNLEKLTSATAQSLQGSKGRDEG